MSTTGRLVRRDRPGVAIVATIDRIPAAAFIRAASLDAAGRLALEFEGGSMVDWNGQTTVTRAGCRLFLDAEGEEVAETGVLLQQDGEPIEPRWRPVAARVQAAIEPMFTLSTAHLEQATLAALCGGASRGVAPHRAIVHDYGVILYVGDPAPCAPDVADVLKLARAHDCVWVNFDVDAAELVDLPTYPSAS